MKYMEKKNMVLLTVIAVATLLVAVVGATFAYFTAQSTTTGNSTKTSATTAQLASLSWIAEESGKSPQVYPGYMAFQAYTLAATGTGKAQYQLTLDATVDPAFTSGDVTYSIYKATSEVTSSLFTPGNANVDTTTEPGVARYSIQNAAFNDTDLTVVVEDKPLVTASGTVITSEDGSSVQRVNTITGGTTEYYVLVLHYPNKDSKQDQQGKAFSASLKLTAIATGN